MSKHVIIDTVAQQLICRHCGAMQVLNTPAPMAEVANVMTDFSASHTHCPRPAVLPVVKPVRPAPNTTTKVLFAWPGLAAWLDEGDRGVSSEAIVQTITGIPMRDDPRDVPRDASDFLRCTGLLRQVPSLRQHLAKMGAVSPRCARLVTAWPDLEAWLADPELQRDANAWLCRNATTEDSP